MSREIKYKNNKEIKKIILENIEKSPSKIQTIIFEKLEVYPSASTIKTYKDELIGIIKQKIKL